MRETRLFSYATAAECNFATHEITVPLAPPPPVLGTWAGLAQEALSWRVEGGSRIRFEHLHTGRVLTLSFSAALSCRPCVTPSGAGHVLLTAACAAGAAGGTLLRVRLDPSLAAAPEEIGRLSLPSAAVTAIQRVAEDVVVGLSDGRAALVAEHPALALRPFVAPPPAPGDTRRDQGENTSMVSRESADSAGSNRSMASSMSFGLMNRLFGSPRGAPAPARPAPTVEHSHMALSTPFRESLRARTSPGDAVRALAEVKLDTPALFTLHASGRVCMFTKQNDRFQFVGDTALPVKMSAATVEHFLLTGHTASAIAVVMVDEDPSADSLRVYNIASKFRQNRSGALSCTQIAKRDGPVGRVVSAVFTDDDVVVGTDSGALSSLLNVSSEFDSGAGIPSGTIWTVMDDVDKPFGLGRTLDEVSSGPKGPLLSAHRFSPYAVAKAMRNPDPTAATREDITNAVHALEFPDDEESMWNRVRTRAEQITKLEDAKVRDVSLIEGVGIVVARQTSVNVLRGLSDIERRAFGNCSQLLNDRVSVAKGLIARLLSSHAVCQVLASQYRVDSVTGAADPKVLFMLSICSKFSENVSTIPLSDILLRGARSRQTEGDEFPNLGSAISHGISILEPGAKLLKGLLASSEMEPLTLSAEQSADALPISSMFASGVAWLSLYRKASSQSSVGTDAEDPREEALAEEDERLNMMLEKSYGFLVAAARWCDKNEADGGEDAQCAIALAGLSNSVRQSVDQKAAEAVAMMTDSPAPSYSSVIPNGPDEKLVRDHLGFWLLERAVRLLESSGAPKSAAAAALEAMERAPDRKRHEMMRAAAFSRFLDAGSRDHALTAILTDPFPGEEDVATTLEESGALRDALGLFVNTTVDRGDLQWLAEYELPEPLRVLCGHALERRARAADPLQISNRMLRKSRTLNAMVDDEEEGEEEDRPTSEYEVLYSWHILRGDESSAAAASLEWAERLSREGQGLLQRVINGKPPIIISEQQIRLMLLWVRAKLEALALTSAAAQLQPPRQRYVPRSRFSILLDEPEQKSPAVIDMTWISRRQLLAQAQSRCLTVYLSQCEHGEAPDVRYLMGPGSPFLKENREGVAWAVSMLSKHPSYECASLSVELCRAWVDEIGDDPLVECVRLAARNASLPDVKELDYKGLDQIVQGLFSATDSKRSRRNWYLIAFESALGRSAGTCGCPQWLIDAAAWGTAPFGEGTHSSHRQFSPRPHGDATAVVRVLLRNNRPMDAARLLISGLAALEKSDKSNFYVPYAAIDVTLNLLSRIAPQFPTALSYREKLLERTEAHLKRMEEMSQEAADSSDVMESSSGHSMSVENDVGVMEATPA